MKFKKLHPLAITPTYATEGAAAFDLYSTDMVTIRPGEAETIGTGIAFELEPYQAMFIYSRSGHGFKSGVRLANCVGVIDPDYRGEVKVRLHNDGIKPFVVNIGDRIAQGVVQLIVPVYFDEVDTLADTERGNNGFGSTGI